MMIFARTIIALLVLLLSCGLPPLAGLAAETKDLALEKAIPLANVSGRIDHMAVDLARHRLAIAELGNNTVDIVDLSNARVIHRIAGLRAPQGVAFVRSADLFAVASADGGTVDFFRARDFSPTGRLDLGADADNIRLNTRTGELIVGYGAGGLAVIDPTSRSKVGDIPLPAHPEGFQLDVDGRRAFVNLPDAQQIVSVDLVSGRQITSWRNPDLQSNFPMAIDGAGRTLAVAFRDPPRLLMIEAGSGAVIASIETCGDADDVFVDDHRRRIYVSCGEGVIDVLGRGADGLRRLALVKTYAGARTALFVPELDRLFVAARAASPDNTAQLLIFRPAP